MSKPQPAKVVNIDRNSPLDGPVNQVEALGQSAFVAPAIPKFLKGEAKKHYVELVESLGNKHRIINELDADILSMYCVTYARWLKADKELEVDGMTQATPNGYVQMSPAYIIWRDLTGQCLKIARQLGLTPPARFQLKAGVTESQDSFDF